MSEMGLSVALGFFLVAVLGGIVAAELELAWTRFSARRKRSV